MTTPGGQPPGGPSFQKPGTEGVRFDKPGTPTPAPQFGGPAPVLAPDPGPTYDLASWGRRFAAALIDGFVVLVITVAIGAFAWALLSAGDQPRRIYEYDDERATAEFVRVLLVLLAATVCFTVVSLTYAPLWMWRTNGRTLGKQILGIRVIRADGSRMTYGYAVFREFLVKGLLGAIASSFTVYLYALADALWPLWDSERRAIHDYIASTRVVRD